MAKARGPLHSADARGTFGDSLTFSNFKGLHRAFKKSKPRNPRSVDQQLQRSYLSQAILAWRDLDPSSKQYWQQQADSAGKKMSGYNYFLSDYINTMLVPPTPPPSGPVMDGLLFWSRLNENTGLVTYDEISARQGAISGACYWTSGHQGSAIGFSGTSGNIILWFNDPAFQNQNLTMSFWLRPTVPLSTKSHMPFFTYIWDGTPGGYGFYYVNPTFYFQTKTWTIGPNIAGTFFNIDTWYYIVGTKQQGQGGQLFIDTVLKDTSSNTADISYPAGITLRMGELKGFGQPCQCIIDECLIYNRVLNSDEILTNFIY